MNHIGTQRALGLEGAGRSVSMSCCHLKQQAWPLPSPTSCFLLDPWTKIGWPPPPEFLGPCWRGCLGLDILPAAGEERLGAGSGSSSVHLSWRRDTWGRPALATGSTPVPREGKEREQVGLCLSAPQHHCSQQKTVLPEGQEPLRFPEAPGTQKKSSWVAEPALSSLLAPPFFLFFLLKLIDVSF